MQKIDFRTKVQLTGIILFISGFLVLAIGVVANRSVTIDKIINSLGQLASSAASNYWIFSMFLFIGGAIILWYSTTLGNDNDKKGHMPPN